jgi:hypothetical protein
VVELNLAKVDVESSNLFARSIFRDRSDSGPVFFFSGKRAEGKVMRVLDLTFGVVWR